MKRYKKVLLPALLGIAALAVIAALAGVIENNFKPMWQISSISLDDPLALRQFANQSAPGLLTDCTADCQVGQALVPVTGADAAANPRSEMNAAAAPLPEDGCTAEPDPEFIQEVLVLVNAKRSAQGSPALKLETRLTEAARKHSRDMACRNYFNHRTPEGASPFDRMADESYPFEFAAENLYAGNKIYNSPEMAVKGWMNSPSHRATLLNPIFDEVGIGYYYNPDTYLGGFTTMDFGKQETIPQEPDDLVPGQN